MTAQCYQEEINGAYCLINQFEPIKEIKETETPLPILQILGQYPEVFQEPQELSPPRKQDHKIPLIPGATPVNIRPYPTFL